MLPIAQASLDFICALQAPSGAYPAAPTFSAYAGYAWFRDGSFTAEAASRGGRVSSADAFHDWCAHVVLARAARIEDVCRAVSEGRQVPRDALLPTRYTLHGADGSDEWWDFQTDGYGTWLWSVHTHAARHGLDVSRWRPAIALVVRYLLATWPMPCFDWWEEHDEHRHVATLGAIYGGLAAARTTVPEVDGELAAALSSIAALVASDGVVDGHLTKWLGSAEVDASLAASVVPFGLVPAGSAMANATLDAIARDLDVGGGVHRFREDVFYGGGQWPLLSCLLGWNRLAAGDRAAASAYLAWAVDQADDSGHLPEQVPDHLLAAGERQAWLDRWGPVARPLVWSHAMVVILADELGLL